MVTPWRIRLVSIAEVKDVRFHEPGFDRHDLVQGGHLPHGLHGLVETAILLGLCGALQWLVLFPFAGEKPGQERKPLVRAKTTFGRKKADCLIEDAAVSNSHFQIEAFGREFFIRDLESRNGTYLNGSKVRYSQILPGDQITAGKTTLIFRTSDDSIDR